MTTISESRTIKHGFTFQNIIALLGLVGMAAMGWLSSNIATKGDIDAIRVDIASVRAQSEMLRGIVSGRREFQGCAVRTLDRLSERARIVRPCELQIAE